MASDDNTPPKGNEPPKKAAPARPNRPRPTAPQHTAKASRPAVEEKAPDDDATESEGRFDVIKDRLKQVPKWGWAIVALLIVLIAFFALRPPADDKGKDGEGNFTITYRQQLTQDGVQAGCFVLMEGTKAIGISCIPSK